MASVLTGSSNGASVREGVHNGLNLLLSVISDV